MSKPTTAKCLVELVKNYEGIEKDDLLALFSTELDTYTSLWTFVIGLPLIIVTSISLVSGDVVTVIEKSAWYVAAGVLFLYVITKNRAPREERRRTLECYLTAKSLLKQPPQQKQGIPCPVHATSPSKVYRVPA